MSEQLITIQEFAHQYGVDTETVRSWIKHGFVEYELVGSRKMIKKTKLAKLLVPVDPEDPIV